MTAATICAKYHYRLTNHEWVTAVKDLKPSERDVLYYLRTLEPFGDRQVEVNARAIGEILGLRRETVSRALKRLDQLGYIDMEPTRAIITLLTKQAEDNSTLESNVLTQTFDPNVAGVIYRSHPRPTDHTDYIYTNSTNSLTQSNEGVSKNAYEKRQEERQSGTSRNSPSSLKEDLEIREKPKLSNEGKNFVAAGRPVENPNVQIAVDDWLNNAVFIHWWANRVSRTDFGANKLVMHPIAFVRQTTRKNPEIAEDMYYAFQAEMTQRVSVYNQRLLGGISISPAEHEEIATIAPYSDVAITKPTQALALGAVQVLAPVENPPKPDQALKSAAPLATTPKPATNGGAYEVKTSHTTAEDLTPSKPPEWLAEQLKQLMNKSGMPRADKQRFAAQPTDPLEKYKAWMQDPILRREAIKWASKRDDLVVMRDDNGEIYDFDWIDF